MLVHLNAFSVFLLLTFLFHQSWLLLFNLQVTLEKSWKRLSLNVKYLLHFTLRERTTDYIVQCISGLVCSRLEFCLKIELNLLYMAQWLIKKQRKFWKFWKMSVIKLQSFCLMWQCKGHNSNEVRMVFLSGLWWMVTCHFLPPLYYWHRDC